MIGIAEATILFLATPGDAIGPDFVIGNSNVGLDPVPLAIGESQYFAYYDDSDFESFDGFYFPDFVDSDDNYGWFRLDRDADGWLSITTGATAVGAGITVGTTESFAIPEPSSFALLFAWGMIGCTRRSRKPV